MPAIAGVSDDQVNVVTTWLPLPSRRVAKSWSWKPTGSAGSVGRRPLNVIVLEGGGGGLLLQKPKVLGFGPLHAPASSRCSDWPTGADASSAPISVETLPTAGPSAAVNVPSYERNSTICDVASISANPSGLPF